MALTKPELRREIRRRVAEMPPDEKAAESAAVCAHLREALPGGLISAYVAMDDEVDLSAILKLLAEQGRLVLPRVAGEGLLLHHVATLADLGRGSWKLTEPRSDAPVVAPTEVAAYIVPLRAFDASNRRMGRGKGHYDTLLAKAPDVPTFGVAFRTQQVDEVPTEPHDRALTLVVTA